MADKPNALNVEQPKNPTFVTGNKRRVVDYRASVTSGNSAVNDKFVLVEGLSTGDRIAEIRGTIPSLTSASDCNLGFWAKNPDGTFTELDRDIIWDGRTLASGLTGANLLLATTQAAGYSWDKNIGQLLDIGSDKDRTNICLVLETIVANTATGPLLVNLSIEIDEATTN